MDEYLLLKKHSEDFLVIAKEFFEEYLNEGNKLLQSIDLTDEFLESVDGQTALLFSNWLQMLDALYILFKNRRVYASQAYVRIMWEIYIQIKFLLLCKEDAQEKARYLIVSSQIKKRDILKKYIELENSDDGISKSNLYFETIEKQISMAKNRFGLNDKNFSSKDWFDDFLNNNRESNKKYLKVYEKKKAHYSLEDIVSFKNNFGKIAPKYIRELLYKNLSLFTHGLCCNDRIYKHNGKYQFMPDYWICNGSLWMHIILIMYEDMHATFKGFFLNFERNFPRNIEQLTVQLNRISTARKIDNDIINIICKYIS